MNFLSNVRHDMRFVPGIDSLTDQDVEHNITLAMTEFHKQGIDCPRLDRFIDMVKHFCANQINGTNHAAPQFVPLSSEVAANHRS